MATGGWVVDLDTKKHKNWVMVGCALNITKKGITSKIQQEVEPWYQSLISRPPLKSLPSCTCASGTPKCASCVTWEAELTRLHLAPRPRICWNNSDRKQWGSPTAAWEIAKLYMPTLGGRKVDVVNAETTDTSGLLNLLEWCPFINPRVSCTVLTSAREGRNHWAHAPKQELEDTDVSTIFGQLNGLLSDPVFNADSVAQKAAKDLHDLQCQGLVTVTHAEIEALRLLRQCLVADAKKCQDDLSDFQDKLAQFEAEKKTFDKAMQSDLSEVKNQENLNRETINQLKQELDNVRDILGHHVNDIPKIMLAADNFNKLLSKRNDLSKSLDHIHDDVECIKTKLVVTESKVENLQYEYQSMKCEMSLLHRKVMELKNMVREWDVCRGEKDHDSGVFMCTIPRRLPLFTGRKSALEWLERNIITENIGTEMSCCTKTICGLGGCGKTSLAIEFAWNYKDHFPGGVFWINGESNDNIQKSLSDVFAFVKNDLPSINEDIDYTLNRFLPWLSKKKRPWLLLVDNADELHDSTCSSGIKKIFKGTWQTADPHVSQYGHILLTTRQNSKVVKTFLKLSCPSKECLELDCFTEEEGGSFLMQKTDRQGEANQREAICLAKELGGLPLALEQAAAFISASPIPLSFKDYLEKYQEVSQGVCFLKQEPVSALDTVEAQHRLSVHTTWKMNFEYVRKASAAAASMMHIVAFFDSIDIPLCLINPGSPELHIKELRESISSKTDVAYILRVLSNYSLVSLDQESGVFSIHKLVQEVIRESLSISQWEEALKAAKALLQFAGDASEQSFQIYLQEVKLLKAELEEESKQVT